MRLAGRAALLALPALVLLAGAAGAAERRCGWLWNPTPGNFWLEDRDGRWMLSALGAAGVPGMDDIPDMTTRGWVATNGAYGYGCACLMVETDRAGRRVRRLLSAEPLPLSRCQEDPSLLPPRG
jgi:hypothetical protein